MLTYVFYYLLFMDAFIFIFIHIHFVFIMTFVILCLLMVQLFGIYAVYISLFFRSVGRSPKFAHRVRLGSIADEIAAPLSVACSCTAVEVWYVHTKSFLLYLFRDDSYGGRGRSSFVCDVLADFVGTFAALACSVSFTVFVDFSEKLVPPMQLSGFLTPGLWCSSPSQTVDLGSWRSSPVLGLRCWLGLPLRLLLPRRGRSLLASSGT